MRKARRSRQGHFQCCWCLLENTPLISFLSLNKLRRCRNSPLNIGYKWYSIIKKKHLPIMRPIRAKANVSGRLWIIFINWDYIVIGREYRHSDISRFLLVRWWRYKLLWCFVGRVIRNQFCSESVTVQRWELSLAVSLLLALNLLYYFFYFFSHHVMTFFRHEKRVNYEKH